ncbi:30S ribosomal protein S17 [Inmirania thermothiophila]|uniref:Small ribosomal subunit protein uS17 n=1 Tax=Inmirania thermothiophila TaxID=1750597 RepID=A0A3N1Y7Q8_9GAMM|nr:30S ribosomal protein S17 [Inmirania thermothiophila]ROR34833.1 SSU ribosomal protein S17P [Inmirania thermothiophila]
MSEVHNGERRARTIVGRVVSDKMDKTVTVLIERRVKHPLYGKYVRRSTKVYAHDEDNACREGDTVRIQETRPLSRLKRWRLVEIVERAERLD